MKTAPCFALFSAILASGLCAQTQAPPAATPPPHHIRISAKVAEKMLIHKAEIICPRIPMAAHVIGTVVVAIVIDKNGDVLHPKIISGPAMLQKPVLDAVRKYKYKPYLMALDNSFTSFPPHGKAVEVETTVSVTMDSNVDCHYDAR